ncbi:Ras-related protein Rab-11C [Tritrichomonas foetus]|uniref:Ras-related protein Rab-11C n=1 Tax=Tritrichomonas foetus TaxID=1144522 RepID=A0A1J4IZT8_9EUKA|nr:Ras-related protein Rab-11C [Tritrichomonas foetus]|eukprot:OHS92918.1 Ras-related protein Rab-11C [Tritrichomonas foetus]
MRASHILKHKIVMIGDSLVGKTSLLHRLTRDAFLSSCQSTVGTGCGTWSTVVENDPMYLQIWDTAGQERYRSLGGIFYQNAEAAIVVFSKGDARSAKNVESWVTQFRAVMGTSPFIAIVQNKSDFGTPEKHIDRPNSAPNSSLTNFNENSYSPYNSNISSYSQPVSSKNIITDSTDDSSSSQSIINHSSSDPYSDDSQTESEINSSKTDDGPNVNSNSDDIDVAKWAKQKGFFYIETSAKTGENVQELFQTVAKSISQKLEAPSKLLIPPATILAMQNAKKTVKQCC